MKNTNTVFENTYASVTGVDNLPQILKNQGANSFFYLKDGLHKYQHFIEEQRKNIKRLNSLRLHMEATGKICPKAWRWGRFYKLFHPMHESYWLSTWWETTDEEKRHRFNEQLNYLACQTIRFREAHTFLLKIEDRGWHFKVDNLP